MQTIKNPSERKVFQHWHSKLENRNQLETLKKNIGAWLVPI